MSTLAGAILAGGQSRRMGQPKAQILLADGRTMMEHVFEALASACALIAVVGRAGGPGWETAGRTVLISDLRPGCGPLAGVEALLQSGLAERYLVVACDQPLLSGRLLRQLAQTGGALPVFLATEGGRQLDPLPCLLPAGWCTTVKQALDDDELSFKRLVRASQIRRSTIPDAWASQTRSFNTPEDLKDLSNLSASR